MVTEQKSFRSAPQIEQMLAPTQQAATNLVLSEPMQVDISLYRGDSGGFRIQVKDINGEPVDVAAAMWDADIRLSVNAPTVLSSFEIVPVSGDPSSIDVLLSGENSSLLAGNCVYDIEMSLGGSVVTLIYGSITVTQDVSRAV